MEPDTDTRNQWFGLPLNSRPRSIVFYKTTMSDLAKVLGTTEEELGARARIGIGGEIEVRGPGGWE